MTSATSDRARSRTAPGTAWVWVLVAVVAVRAGQGWLARTVPGEYRHLALAADLAAVCFVLAAVVRARSRRFALSTTGWVALLFIVVSILGALNPSVLGTTLSLYGIRAMTLALALGLAVAVTPWSEGQRRILVDALLLAVLANGAWGLKQAVLGLSPAETASLAQRGSTYLVGDATRLIGLQATGQDFALLMGGAAAWSVARCLDRGVKAAGLLTVLTAIVSSLSVILVLQRGPALGFVAAVACAAVAVVVRRATPQRRGSIVTVAAAVGVVVVTMFAVNAAAPARFASATAELTSLAHLGNDRSYAIRSAVTVPVSVALVEADPLGYGTGASGPVAELYPAQTPLAAFPLGGVVADNGYLFVALQVGLLGMAVFLALMIGWSVTGSLTRNPDADAFSGRAFAIFLSIAMLTGSYWGLAATLSLPLLLACVGARSPATDTSGTNSPVDHVAPSRQIAAARR